MSFQISFFRRRAGPLVGRIDDGWRVYAIGDVHGCVEPLERLLDAIEADLQKSKARGRLVFLGDLIDRGPASCDVIERVLSKNLPGERHSFLMGNHEEVFLDCYDGNVQRCGQWLQYGGLQTLESYGLSRAQILERPFQLPEVMAAAIPSEHVAFLRSFADQIQVGNYLFVHAGIRPGVALEEQTARDLRWIRDGFLESTANHGSIVVHGHSIVPDIDVRPNRIAVDTGCYRGGTLSALVLEGESKGKIVVGGPGASPADS